MPLFQLILNIIPLVLGFAIKTVFFLKKGFARTYIHGIAEGFRMCDRKNKVSFSGNNMKNYIRIQFELWGIMFRRF
jgi:hypothetical protein